MRRNLIVAGAALVLSAGAAVAQTPPAGDAEAGRDVFSAECRACHSGAIGPVLSGVVGRKVASAPGYAYSDALKAKAAETWTAASLDAYLTAPSTYAPGTKMPLAVSDAQKRADVIAYLKSRGADS